MWIRWFWFLLANKDASSIWSDNPSCKTARNCVEIHNMNRQRNWGGRTLAVKCVHIFGNGGRSEMWNYRFLQSRQKGNAEAEIPVFGNEDRVLVEKPIFRSVAVKTEQKYRSETAHLWKSRRRWNAKAERHIFGSPGRTSAESGTSDLCQSRQSGSAKQNFIYLAVNAERKCGSGTSHFWQSMQNESTDMKLQIFGSKDRAEAELQIFGSQGSAEAEHQVFGSQGRAEVWKRNFRSLAVKTEQKCGSSTADLWQSSQVGHAEADLNIFDRPISTDCHWQCKRITLLTSISKDNVKTMCG